MRPALEVPADFAGMEIIASVSGGKDSTAMVLALLEAEIPHRRVFADTGWEADETYRYLDYLRRELGPIDVVRARATAKKPAGGMVERSLYRGGFPTRRGRWCTAELKIEPIRDYHGDRQDVTGVATCSAVGIRAAEGPKRAAMPAVELELEGPRSFGWPVWRPLLDWTIEDVLEAHARNGLEVNPLYRRGHDRVGCYPCIFSRKEEVRLIAEHAPERIDQIRELEAELTRLRAERNEATPGRYSAGAATFFLPVVRNERASIDDVVAWSRTSRGGRQSQLFPNDAERGGCYRWGLCDPGAGA